ncbi:MAG TPA: sigma-54 dependent transcriptional regulator [Burkholderiales bacterium]|nr:sigma-54 dependent transcriptional regulator [Burkholderiales bacterium]
MARIGDCNLIGRSPAFAAATALIGKFATCDATVLIEGETGTGKELAARAIHYLSARSGCPFIPVNCGALPDTLAENELFGHVRGAYTDARESHTGLVSRAEGGTLFLDEIESLSAKGQVVLLRFLQDGAYRPLGGRSQVAGNARVVAASNVDLVELVKSGAFRQDLLYRLALLTLRMPPLRERAGDARVLAEHFMQQFRLRYARPGMHFAPHFLDALAERAWPGNVRELENLVHRAFLLAEGTLVDVPAAPAAAPAAARPAAAIPLPAARSFRQAKALVVAEFEREFAKRALEESGGNVSAAARLAGKERRAFGRLLRKHGIDRSAFG